MAAFWANVLGIVIFVVLIFVSIALHELGHFATAKRFGVKVTEFMIGFGPKLVARVRGETSYGIKAVPVGGYVRIVGMYPPERVGAAAAPAHGRFSGLVDEARRQSLEEIEPGDEDRVFYRLPVGKRIVVMMAGPFMNLILAFVLFSIMLVGIGLPEPSPRLSAVIPCVPTVANPDGQVATDGSCSGSAATAAAQAGLAAGDVLRSIDGASVATWDDLTAAVQAAAGPTEVTFERDGALQTRSIDLTPIAYPVLDSDGRATGETTQRLFLGVRPDVVYEGLPIAEVPAYMWEITTTSVGALLTMPQRIYDLGVTLVTNGERSPESPVSVVGVSRLGGEIAAADEPMAAKVGSFLGLAASLNLFLFLFNLLPILPLDGGHVAAALYEGARRRIASWRGSPDPGPVDTARLLPVTYSVAIILITVGAMVIWADLVKPITLG